VTDSNTSLPGFVWPAIHPAPDAGMLALLFQLGQTQWWPAERLRDSQLPQLRALLRHAYAHTPFHRDRMRGCDFDPYADFGWDEFLRLPLLTRAELQRNTEALDGRAGLTGHGEFLPGTSSGSTGMPVNFFSTGASRLMWSAVTLRDHQWHGRDLSLKLASIGDFPHAIDLPNWGYPAASVMQTGPAAAYSIEETAERQVDWLQREQADYLLTYATNLDALLRHCRDRRIRLPKLREVRTIAETLPLHLRDFCREVWGVPLHDIYSAREAGYIALQCPAADHYHVQSESAVLEVLDSDGLACKPGQPGKVVITVLNNFATPLIRYEIGDIAVPGEACRCGRGLPVLERVGGRVRNLLTLPNGEQRFPDFGAKFYGEIALVTQFQLVQKTLQRMELRVVAERKPTKAEEAAIKRRLNSQLHHTFEIDLVVCDTIARGPGGKYEEFRSELEIPPV
jgi:phenylacetate-CoA ligase